MSMTGLDYDEQATPWTNQAAKKLGKALPEAFGPVTSPLRIEHTVRAYTGTMGLYAMNAMDWVIRQADSDIPIQPTRRWYEKPVLSRFIKGEAKTARYNKYTQKVYDVIDEANKAQRTFNKMVKEGRREDAIAKLKDKRPLVDASGKATEGSARKRLLDVQAQLRSINEKQRAVELSRVMDPDRKRELLDRLQEQRHRVLAGAAILLDRIKELEE
jgi:hypothetical protein